MHTKLNGIVKAARFLVRSHKLRGFCRSMEKFATMEWNEEELNRRKRVVTSFTEVVTTLQRWQQSCSRRRREERKGEFLSGQSASGEGEGGIVIRDSGIGLQCKEFVRIGSCSIVAGESGS